MFKQGLINAKHTGVVKIGRDSLSSVTHDDFMVLFSMVARGVQMSIKRKVYRLLKYELFSGLAVLVVRLQTYVGLKKHNMPYSANYKLKLDYNQLMDYAVKYGLYHNELFQHFIMCNCKNITHGFTVKSDLFRKFNKGTLTEQELECVPVDFCIRASIRGIGRISLGNIIDESCLPDLKFYKRYNNMDMIILLVAIKYYWTIDKKVSIWVGGEPIKFNGLNAIRQQEVASGVYCGINMCKFLYFLDAYYCSLSDDNLRMVEQYSQ